MEDITARKQLEEVWAARGAQEEAAREQVEQLRQLFLSAVSHELLTPLAIIQGHAQLLGDPSTRATPLLADNALEAIREETHRLQRLVTNLLTTTRARAGAFQIAPVPLALGPLVERAVQHFQGRTRRHQLQLDLPADLPAILGDRDSLESVVYNLLDNAYKYAPHGGEIRVGVLVHDATVELTVQDQGLGIAPAEQPQIFEPHYRATAMRQRPITGTGLGLYLCAVVVEAHGGRIWVESTLGQGSVFHVTLPRADAEAW
jgi:signal transduction histidine kinase